jgi:hypothetical protein
MADKRLEFAIYLKLFRADAVFCGEIVLVVHCLPALSCFLVLYIGKSGGFPNRGFTENPLYSGFEPGIFGAKFGRNV